ncbi:MAG: tRNA (adenosine(37)-N6)-threonylcarbamoyltransferase complex dimerization subunit type 1 TsaB [Anaerolineales bacterium]|nr:tRNA (adenosine(37)-N6)-threonylcarbamoyltransferase complex dimerization subunit type 1 TsaB [Anaerolineales bacterium]
MILALDTATRQISLALYDGQRVISEHTWRTAATHSVELAPQAALMLRQAGLAPAALTGLAVALGPGSYTSLRIGLGFAKGLALAHGLPLIGVPTLEIIMRAVGPIGMPALRALALLAAGRGRAVAADYWWDGHAWLAPEAPRLLAWGDLAAEIHAPTLICGEWEAAPPEPLRALRAVSQATLAAPASALRRAGYLAEIGWERLRAGQVDETPTLAPLYASHPDGAPA